MLSKNDFTYFVGQYRDSYCAAADKAGQGDRARALWQEAEKHLEYRTGMTHDDIRPAMGEAIKKAASVQI